MKTFADLQQIISDLSEVAGVHCLWKRSRHCLTEHRLPGVSFMHRHDFCVAAKNRPDGLLRCMRHDTVRMAKMADRSAGKAFLLECPWGALEFIVPVTDGERIAGVVIFGPYAKSGDNETTLPRWRGGLADPLERLTHHALDSTARELYAMRPEMKLHDERIMAVLDYLSENYSREVTLKDAAEKVFLSASRLSHLFREDCGIDFKSYLLQLRLNTAAALLSDSCMSMAQIAAACGFASQNHFCTIFKIHFSVTPSIFRRSRR